MHIDPAGLGLVNRSSPVCSSSALQMWRSLVTETSHAASRAKDFLQHVGMPCFSTRLIDV
jgi:hypothetical protein